MDFDSSFNENVDSSTSHYALQVALQNMKERYKKLQKKIGLLEEENNRLIEGKSELFGEIGKMQENSIKLREKNLQLNQEIHSKHKECCSLKDKFTQISEENIHLSSQVSLTSQEKGRLSKQIEDMHKENEYLRESISKTLQTIKTSTGVNEAISHLETILLHSQATAALTKMKVILPSSDLLMRNELEYQGVSKDESPDEAPYTLRNKSFSSLQCLEKAKENTNTILFMLQDQKKMLLSFSQLYQSIKDKEKGMVTQPHEATSNEAAHGLGEVPTFGSFLYGGMPLNKETELLQLLADNHGKTNIEIEGDKDSNDSFRMSFDWRKVKLCDEEEDERDPPTLKASSKPSTRTVSTSPDHIFIYEESQKGTHIDRFLDSNEESDRTCPMCKEIFPTYVPQESFESHVVNHFEEESDFEILS